jgi:hypothetical protein
VEPHGLEGFGPCLGHVGRRDFSVADGEGLEVVEVDCDATFTTPVALLDLDDDVVAAVLGSKSLELDRLPSGEPAGPEFTDAVVSAIDLAMSGRANPDISQRMFSSHTSKGDS